MNKPGQAARYVEVINSADAVTTKYNSKNMTYRDFGPDFAILEETYSPSLNTCCLVLEDQRTRGKCPHCDQESNDLAGFAPHYAVGLPDFHGYAIGVPRKTILCIRQRRLCCNNPQCPGRIKKNGGGENKHVTFQLPSSFIDKYKRAVKIALSTSLVFGIIGSMRTAESAMASLCMPISRWQIRRSIMKVKVIFDGKPTIIGVDEVYISHLRGFYTVVYDFFTHVCLAIFPGKDAVKLIPWLEANKDTIIAVCRDRSSAFSAAIESTCLPGTIQIADYFHLESNKNDQIWREIKKILPFEGVYVSFGTGENGEETVELLPGQPSMELTLPDYSSQYPKVFPGLQPVAVHINIGPSAYEYRRAQDKAAHQGQAKVAEIRKVRQCAEKVIADYGELSYARLKYLTGDSIPTIKNYLNMSEDDIKALLAPETYLKTVEYNPIVNLIYRMMDMQIASPVIYSYIISNNLFSGDEADLELLISRIGCNHFKRNPFRVSQHKVQKLPKGVVHFCRKAISCYCCTTNPKTKKSEKLEKAIGVIMEKYPQLERLQKCAQDFSFMLRREDPSRLDTFIQTYKDLLPQFCNGLEKDREAVRNAIIFGRILNSAFVEGENNLYKTCKRIGCGAYGDEMTQKKVVLYELRKEIDPFSVCRTGECHIPDKSSGSAILGQLLTMRACA